MNPAAFIQSFEVPFDLRQATRRLLLSWHESTVFKTLSYRDSFQVDLLMLWDSLVDRLNVRDPFFDTHVWRSLNGIRVVCNRHDVPAIPFGASSDTHTGSEF